MTKGSNLKKSIKVNKTATKTATKTSIKTIKQNIQSGGSSTYSYTTATSSPNAPQIRSFTLTSPTQPYPLEGAPMFPPTFMTDGSCSVL